MKRHLIFGRFGPTDREKIPAGNEEIATRLQFVIANRRLEHDITDALASLAKMGVFPSETGIDLLVLAAHIHAADTRISRASEAQDGWTREIRLVIPVSDPTKWNRCIPLLQRILNFLTGDKWTVGFRPRPKGFEHIAPDRPTQPSSVLFDELTLFSGGLDSLIGAINLLEDGKIPLLISHADSTTSKAQKDLFDGLKNKYSTRNFERLRFWITFRGFKVNRVSTETTARAFLPVFCSRHFCGNRVRRRVYSFGAGEWLNRAQCSSRPSASRRL
jgi:hypothetical protein